VSAVREEDCAVRTRLQIVGVVAALLLGLVMPAAVAQADNPPTWWKCDERGRCVFEMPARRMVPLLDETAVDEMNDWAAQLAEALEEAGIEHDVVTLDVVTWDRSDPEANRVVARFWQRLLPEDPGEGFSPWPVPDREEGRRILEFEGIWPDDLPLLLEEWLGEGFPMLDDFPFFGDDPMRWRRGPMNWIPGPDPESDPPELFDEEGRPLDLGGLGSLLEEFFGDEGLGSVLEDLFGEDPGSLFEDFGGGEDFGSLLEEFFGDEGLGSFLEDLFGGDPGSLFEDFGGALPGPFGGSGVIATLDESMSGLAEFLESHGVETVTINLPIGLGLVVWDFFDEEAADLVTEFFAEHEAGEGEVTSRDDGVTWEVPEWGWPFHGGGP
jgi:hypothetical protein